MGLTEFALSQALYMALNHVNKSGIILKTAQEFDKLTDERLGLKGSERLQEKIVTDVLLPLARELMKESRFAYQAALQSECKLVGGSGQQEFEHRAAPQSRSNVQPKH